MKRVWFLILFATLILAVSSLGIGLCLATEPPPEGGILPDLSLPAPQDTAEAQYLGVEGRKTFKIPQIKADLVIVEIFSMYCPYCQKEAPTVDKLYQAIAKRQSMKDKVKIIGIGAGNTPFEVKTFKDKYQVPFPLFADEDYSLHQMLGEVRTPYFMAVKINKDGSHKVVYSELGSFGDAEDFLQRVLKKSGME